MSTFVFLSFDLSTTFVEKEESTSSSFFSTGGVEGVVFSVTETFSAEKLFVPALFREEVEALLLELEILLELLSVLLLQPDKDRIAKNKINIIAFIYYNIIWYLIKSISFQQIIYKYYNQNQDKYWQIFKK